jgi:hypothetical protein
LQKILRVQYSSVEKETETEGALQSTTHVLTGKARDLSLKTDGITQRTEEAKRCLPPMQKKKRKEGNISSSIYKAEQSRRRRSTSASHGRRCVLSFLPTATTNSNTVRKQARGRRDERE